MTTEYLTIKEASERYGKAEITIRRLVRNLVKSATPEERDHIRPTPDEVKKLKTKRKPFSYSVSAEMLGRHYSAADVNKQTVQKEAARVIESKGEYVDLLKKTNGNLSDQMRVKDEQIRALTQALDGLSERQRETNILMKGLQEQLLLGSGENKKSWWKVW